MLWQAETGFYFRMPEGYLGHFAPPQFEHEQVVGELLFEENKGVNTTLFASFLKTHDVGAIVVESAAVSSNLRLIVEFSNLGLRASQVGGVLLYQVPPSGI